MNFLKTMRQRIRPDGVATATMNDKADALQTWVDAQKMQNPVEGSSFQAVPEITNDQPGFEKILAKLNSDERFVFAKLNHGFWERLASLEKLGTDRRDFLNIPGEKIDADLGIAGSKFAEGGLLADLLHHLQQLAPPEDGMIFVPSLTPWPLSDRIEGTPFQNRKHCEDLIGHFVPAAHLSYSAAHGYTGCEFKVAVITGSMTKFVEALKDRSVLLIGNSANRALIDAAALNDVEIIEVHQSRARLDREMLLAQMFDFLKKHQDSERPPVVITAAGGALASWLGMEAFYEFDAVQFIDLGGSLAAYDAPTARRLNWTRAFRRQLAQSVKQVTNLPDTLSEAYAGPYGLRDANIVELAIDCGVAPPGSSSLGEHAAPISEEPIAFIENKIYDHARIADFLSLSIAENHHANSGPVAALLERAVAVTAGLPPNRKVVAVNSGTTALHMACGFHWRTQGAQSIRWVTSAFNFFSAQVGPLANSLVIDCDEAGGFDLAALKALPPESYDGVIYTNVFAQHSDWDALAEFCRSNGKHLVIDNATGLLDRPPGATADNAPMEIISGHHTKSWGVGEGGFIICNADEEPVLRQLANFGATLPDDANPMSSNYKISDLAAAAILDRLERLPYWAYYYRQQERRNKSLMIDADIGITEMRGSTAALSPRSHTPFLCEQPVDINAVTGAVTLRKYYRPLVATAGIDATFPNAASLYARTFSLSNCPEMRLVPNSAIISQVTAMVKACGQSS